jgi:cytidine deaminase
MPAASLSSELQERLLRAARDVARNAHAPYSNFLIGAAVLTDDGTIYRGCNVENASYGLTICAERAAIFAAVAGEGAENIQIQAIAVQTTSGAPASPCGACRQVIFEFNPDTLVIFQTDEGAEITTARELLPLGFRLE